MNSAMRFLAAGQGGYYLLTGLWAILHRTSFETFTGPKTDYWLVITVSLQICAIALTLLSAAWMNALSASIRILAISSAGGLLFVDLYYPMAGRIPVTYLLDAGPQFTFIAGWVALSVWSLRRRVSD